MKVLNYLKENRIYLDGGMGTLLQAQGLKSGEYPELWNITHPDIITGIHKEYFDAGSNIVCTNTFGANLLKFNHSELEKIISCAVCNARRAMAISDSPQEKFVALDVGPCGKMLKPYGDLDFEDAVALFAETVKLGVEYGVDLIFIETMNDSYETKAAVLAAKENSDLPVFVSNVYGNDGRLMTGATPCAMVAMLEGLRVDAIGANCSLGPRQLAPIIDQLLKYSSTPIFVKPNAGLPIIKDGKTEFGVLPKEFADELYHIAKNGVNICGGCCGTTPEHINALVDKTSSLPYVKTEPKNHSIVSSFSTAVEISERPILIGERINPTGKKRFKQALCENDIGYILREAIEQENCGAHILDVNVGLPEINEAEMIKNVIYEIQAVTSLPLQIDTSDSCAMEAALRRYNGKAMVNSVNGKDESMRAIFPLVQKYGGLVVALTLDENGIPQTAEERLKIARKILSVANEYGIDKKDIIFDTLTMAVSADASAAKITLDSLDLIHNELGANTILGVSNVSFGLPCRDIINSSFFTLALGNHLNAAIMNPYSMDMMRAYRSFCALNLFDKNFEEYISFAHKENAQSNIANNQAIDSVASDHDLEHAIIKGLKEKAREITVELLKTNEPHEIVKTYVIPALDKVGKGFENQTIYLPSLLMSAEAAKFAFEPIKNELCKTKSENNRMCIVIATVKGDIHDIGKNIVSLLLENYGFRVVDLGKDVDPEEIVSAAINSGAEMVALSALMTTTVPAMEKTISMLRLKNPDIKVVVGGAVLNEDYSNMIGADKYASDAMEAVRYAEYVESIL